MQIIILKLLILFGAFIFLNKFCLRKKFLLDQKGLAKHKFFVRDFQEVPITSGMIFIMGIFLFLNFDAYFVYLFTLLIFLIGI